ncbi:pirin family protein [Photobacterium iliopiscarium]|uniref:pirin family protein n=1 Tax=Photobacterium iliopiscarium TaxID=56192 RepID=UPI001E386AA7|nr:pirin family protein [Photobacterium iliopiscarium]MCD9488203.1 nuclease PIN [Photobacterium iliopiscarium]MCF2244887.1 nuclease PIN [Photobacterium iliopiscarium]
MPKSRQLTHIRHGIKKGITTSFIHEKHFPTTNPFFLWEHFTSKQNNTHALNFHGHSGIEAISYPLTGTILHHDSTHQHHIVKSGDIHIMTSGQGIIHKSTTLPQQSISESFQLWMALPATNNNEMCQPKSQLFNKDNFPLVETNNSTTKVLVGHYHQYDSPVKSHCELILLDIIMASYSSWYFSPPKQHLSGFIYLKSGVAYSANNKLTPFQMGLFESSSSPIIITTTSQSSRFIIAVAIPLKQPLITNQHSVHSCENNINKSQTTINELLSNINQLNC